MYSFREAYLLANLTYLRMFNSCNQEIETAAMVAKKTTIEVITLSLMVIIKQTQEEIICSAEMELLVNHIQLM